MEITSLSGQQRMGAERVLQKGVSDFIIKYEPPPSDGPRPAEHDVREELVHGGEGDVIEAVSRLVESGRTTPGRIRIYANMGPVVTTNVQFGSATARR